MFQLAVQRALDTLDSEPRLPGELVIVHDVGPQFLAREWKLFVHNGKGRDRILTLGAGSIKIRAPRVHDRRPDQCFTSRILPLYMHGSPRLGEALLVLPCTRKVKGRGMPMPVLAVGDGALGFWGALRNVYP